MAQKQKEHVSQCLAHSEGGTRDVRCSRVVCNVRTEVGPDSFGRNTVVKCRSHGTWAGRWRGKRWGSLGQIAREPCLGRERDWAVAMRWR